MELSSVTSINTSQTISNSGILSSSLRCVDGYTFHCTTLQNRAGYDSNA